STCDTPPSMKSRMTFFARAGKCGARTAPSAPPANNECKASQPKPCAARWSNARREIGVANAVIQSERWDKLHVLPPHPGPLPWGEGEAKADCLSNQNTGK